jgi:hypothetical protein
MPGIEIPALAVPPGKWGTVEFAYRSSGAKLAEQFLEEMGEDAADFLALFREMAENGRTNNPSRFSQEEGYTFAFRTSATDKSASLFSLGNRWLLTFGFTKGAQAGENGAGGFR